MVVIFKTMDKHHASIYELTIKEIMEKFKIKGTVRIRGVKVQSDQWREEDNKLILEVI